MKTLLIATMVCSGIVFFNTGCSQANASQLTTEHPPKSSDIECSYVKEDVSFFSKSESKFLLLGEKMFSDCTDHWKEAPVEMKEVWKSRCSQIGEKLLGCNKATTTK